VSGRGRGAGKSLKGLPRRVAAMARPLLVRRVVPSPVLAQRASDLLRELNLLVCGADEEELQHIVAAMAASQALATARLREERRHSAARARGGALE
jgi:hypothetical protein